MNTLPDLPYDYNALEPHIDEETMRIHHDKHHQAYIDKLNAAIKGTALEDKKIDDILGDLSGVPKDILGAVQNNGGGHSNHSMFWQVMSADGGGEPDGAVGDAIKETFGSFGSFKEEFAKAAATRFGSGWAWLVVDKGKLKITSTANQDTPLSDGMTPILGLDVWEHAYYLKYQNKRPDYVSAWWNVVNWKKVNELLSSAK